MGVTHPELDAVVIFHHEWKAVKRVCEEYLRFYPSGRIFLARDTLPQYKHPLLSEFPVEYLESFECMQKINEMIWDERPMSELDQETRMKIVLNQVDRLAHASEQVRTDYFLALEYDASVRGRVPIYSGTDLESLDVNKYPDWLLNELLIKTGRPLGIDGWGFVVGTVRREIPSLIASWARNNDAYLRNLVDREPRMVVLDFLYPVVCHLAGGSVANHGLTIECDREKNWKRQKAPLLHQYRGRHLPKANRKNNRASS